MKEDKIADLFDRALTAQELELQEAAGNPAFEALVQDGSDEVFRLAGSLCQSPKRRDRLLGVRLLSELGRIERPFTRAAVAVLVKVVTNETDLDLLRWEIGALGNQHRATALPVLVQLSSHEEPSVRDAVAGAISGAASIAGLDSDSIEALTRLTKDPDGEVRFSAVFELASWWDQGFKDGRVSNALLQAMRDSDTRIVRIASDRLEEDPSD